MYTPTLIEAKLNIIDSKIIKDLNEVCFISDNMKSTIDFFKYKKMYLN